MYALDEWLDLLPEWTTMEHPLGQQRGNVVFLFDQCRHGGLGFEYDQVLVRGFLKP
jgi:hypothetical protein